MRVKLDGRNERLNFKIREAQMEQVPYMVVIGDKEVENGEVAVRTRKGEDLGTMSIEAFCQLLTEDVAKRGRVSL